MLRNELLLKMVLDELDTFVLVTDAETQEICYMNTAMQQEYGVDDTEGRKCWEVLHAGMTERCSFCQVPKLIQEEPGEIRIWTEDNKRSGKVYRHTDQIFIHKGHKYDLQSTSDITSLIRVSRDANLDDLTQLFNRRAGTERLQIMLDGAREKEEVLTLALCDVNDLKIVNDTYGHTEGDRMLLTVAELLRRCLDPDDLIFRYSGDSFIIAFRHMGEKEAEARLRGVLEELEEDEMKNSFGYEVSFSYGIEEIYPEEEGDIKGIINRADAKMYAHKRDFQMQKAKKRLLSSQSRIGSVQDFVCDHSRLYEALSISMGGEDCYIFIGDLHSGTFRYPVAMVEEFGLPGEVIENAAAFWTPLIHEQDRNHFLESNQEIADGRIDYHDIEYRAKNIKGEWVWLRCRGKMLRDKKGVPEIFAGTITNQGKLNTLDAITGLSNKHEFESDIKNLANHGSTDEKVCIMVLNIDGFKEINDLYDRDFGDAVLRIIARKLYNLLPDSAKLYRLDGDEFGVLLNGTSREEGEKLFKRVQRTFFGPQEYSGNRYRCTFSAGAVNYPDDGTTYLELMKFANTAVEYSKLSGKNRFTPFSGSLFDEKRRKLELVKEMRECMEHGYRGFSVVYQPVVSTEDGSLFGAEALARWTSRKYGNVPPNEFIPLMEQNGLIIRFGKWVFSRAAEQCSKWIKYKEDMHISVNASFLQFIDGSLSDHIEETLKKLNMDSSHMILELAESYMVKEEHAISELLKSTRDRGIRLAMDDFGTGYSTALSLKKLPVDVVKLDRSFVSHLDSDGFNAEFIRFISGFLTTIGKDVCAEGVETREEYLLLKDYRVPYIQGYYFGRPMPPEQFEEIYFS